MSKYLMLLNILDKIREEAASTNFKCALDFGEAQVRNGQERGGENVAKSVVGGLGEMVGPWDSNPRHLPCQSTNDTKGTLLRV